LFEETTITVMSCPSGGVVSTAQVVQVLSHAWPWVLWILVVPMLKIASAAAWVLSPWVAGVPADERHKLMVDAARRALCLRARPEDG
jgi:hypothetical protein